MPQVVEPVKSECNIHQDCVVDTKPCSCEAKINVKASGKGVGQIPGWIIGYMRLQGISEFGASESFIKKYSGPSKLFGRFLAEGLSNDEAFCLNQLAKYPLNSRVRQTIYSIFGCTTLMLFDSMHKNHCSTKN